MDSFTRMIDQKTFKSRLFQRKHRRRGVQLFDPNSPYEIADQRCLRELTNGFDDDFDRDRCRLSRDALIAKTYAQYEMMASNQRPSDRSNPNFLAIGRWLRAMWKIKKLEEIESKRSILREHHSGGLLTRFARALAIEFQALLLPFDPSALDRVGRRTVFKTGYIRRQRYEPDSPHEIADQRMIASSNDGWADCFDEMRHRMTRDQLREYISNVAPFPRLGEELSGIALQNHLATVRWLEETRDLPLPDREKWIWPLNNFIYPPLNEASKPDGVFRMDVTEFTQQPICHVIQFSI